MIGLECASAPARPVPRQLTLARYCILLATVIIGAISAQAIGAPPDDGGATSRSSMLKASTSKESRQSAIRSIPFEKLDDEGRAKVQSVLSKVSVYRRMPVRVVDCDPDLYLFLVRHPDVMVNIWEVLDLSNLKLKELEQERYQVQETGGTLATVEFLYKSHDLHIVYAEGTYEGPLFAKPVKGSCLMLLRTGYVREPDGRYYITNRLDSFLSVKHMGAELLAKVFNPLTGKVADMNFIQTVAFAGSLSRTAEVNNQGMQRLAGRLERVQPQVRNRFAQLSDLVSRRATELSLKQPNGGPRVVSFTTEEDSPPTVKR